MECLVTLTVEGGNINVEYSRGALLTQGKAIDFCSAIICKC